MTPVILWFRRDLRLHDQAALLAAVESGRPVIPVFIYDAYHAKHRIYGGASQWWLHHSLSALDDALRARGSRLILRKGASEQVLQQLAAETGADRIFALHHYEPWWRNAEKAVKAELQDAQKGKATLELYHGNFLLPPGFVKTGGGTPYKIYTPFWRALREHMPPAKPRPAPEQIPAPDVWPQSDKLDDWAMLPTRPNWAAGFAEHWQPGEAGAMARLEIFTAKAAKYEERRNFPSIDATSGLSPIWPLVKFRPPHSGIKSWMWVDR